MCSLAHHSMSMGRKCGLIKNHHDIFDSTLGAPPHCFCMGKCRALFYSARIILGILFHYQQLKTYSPISLNTELDGAEHVTLTRAPTR